MKTLLYFLLGMCLVSSTMSAAANYEEPEMEATTSFDALNKTLASSEEDEDSSSEEDSGSDTDCKVTKALQTMGEFLQELGREVDALKKQVANSCSAGAMTNISMNDSSMEGSGSGYDEDEGSGWSSGDYETDTSGDGGDEEPAKPDCPDDDSSEEDGGSGEDEEQEPEDIVTTTPEPTIPPPPTTCPSPFQLLANGCYYIQTDTREWRSFGDAMAFCRQQQGYLASPYRLQDLSEYLEQSYSNTLWVGGRMDDMGWAWLDGRPIPSDSWKPGKPTTHPGKMCMYLDAWNHYKGVDHYCGEKFSFVCEHEGE